MGDMIMPVDTTKRLATGRDHFARMPIRSIASKQISQENQPDAVFDA